MRYVTAYFSREGSAADLVIGFIDRCHHTVDAAVYSITHAGITEALIRAHERGVEVRILTDKVQASSKYATDEILEASGIELRRDRRTGSMHHKFIVGDGLAVATGSFNWTKSADEVNMENFVVIRLKGIAREYSSEFHDLWLLNVPEDTTI